MKNISDKEKINKVLLEFLRGEITFKEFNIAMSGNMDIDFSKAPQKRFIAGIDIEEDIKIKVTKNDVSKMLIKYLENRISNSELSNWASIINMMPNYVPEGNTDDEVFLESESITWQIIKWLALPFLFENISPRVIKKYLNLIAVNE